MYHCPDNYFPSYMQPSNWPTSPLFTPSSSYISEAPDQSTSSSGSTWSYSPAADLKATLSVNNELPRIHPQPQANCFTRTYILLHTLMQPSSNICVFESTDLPSPLSWKPFPESIDQVLVNTDKAIEHVGSVMQCPCCTTSSVRCALTLVIFEVISWYETIVRESTNRKGKRLLVNAAHGQVAMELTLAVLPHGERDLRRLPQVS